MYIIPLTWLYVALMMAVAEATNSNGTILGAVITFVLYGVVPVGLLLYLMGAPARGRAIKAREAAELAQANSATPDADRHAPTDTVTPVREKS